MTATLRCCMYDVIRFCTHAHVWLPCVNLYTIVQELYVYWVAYCELPRPSSSPCYTTLSVYTNCVLDASIKSAVSSYMFFVLKLDKLQAICHMYEVRCVSYTKGEMCSSEGKIFTMKTCCTFCLTSLWQSASLRYNSFSLVPLMVDQVINLIMHMNLCSK